MATISVTTYHDLSQLSGYLADTVELSVSGFENLFPNFLKIEPVSLQKLSWVPYFTFRSNP